MAALWLAHALPLADAGLQCVAPHRSHCHAPAQAERLAQGGLLRTGQPAGAAPAIATTASPHKASTSQAHATGARGAHGAARPRWCARTMRAPAHMRHMHVTHMHARTLACTRRPAPQPAGLRGPHPPPVARPAARQQRPPHAHAPPPARHVPQRVAPLHVERGGPQLWHAGQHLRQPGQQRARGGKVGCWVGVGVWGAARCGCGPSAPRACGAEQRWACAHCARAPTGMLWLNVRRVHDARTATPAAHTWHWLHVPLQARAASQAQAGPGGRPSGAAASGGADAGVGAAAGAGTEGAAGAAAAAAAASSSKRASGSHGRAPGRHAGAVYRAQRKQMMREVRGHVLRIDLGLRPPRSTACARCCGAGSAPPHNSHLTPARAMCAALPQLGLVADSLLASRSTRTTTTSSSATHTPGSSASGQTSSEESEAGQ